MKKFFKKIWAKANGKKTFIGAALHCGWFLINIAFKDIATPAQQLTGHGLIFTITGVGIGHKIEKSINKKP